MNSSPELTEVAPQASGSGSGVISQSEIERLLTQVESVAARPAAGDSPASLNIGGGDFIRRHDFPKLSPLSGADLRPLRVRHEDFIFALGTRLSLHLGLEVTVQLSKMEVLPFSKFADGLSNPTYLTMLKLQPLTGIGLLDIPPRLALCMVDRELGGPGRVAEETSQIGKVEERLLSTVIGLIINEWCAMWRDLMEIQPAVVGHEVNSRYIDTSSPATTMLVVGMETRFGEVVEQMQFAFPHHMLEPLTLKLHTVAANGEKRDASVKISPAKWNSLFDELEIQVKAELPEIQLSAAQVAELKLGDVLSLPPECMNEVRLRLANHPGFLGSLGTSNQRRAVKIEKCLKR